MPTSCRDGLHVRWCRARGDCLDDRLERLRLRRLPDQLHKQTRLRLMNHMTTQSWSGAEKAWTFENHARLVLELASHLASRNQTRRAQVGISPLQINTIIR